MTPIQRSAAPGDGLARERSAPARPLFFSSPDPLMTLAPEELKQRIAAPEGHFAHWATWTVRFREDEHAALRAALDIAVSVGRMRDIVADFVRCHDQGPGLIDCIDNQGDRYTSADLDAVVQRARAALASSSTTEEAK